MRYNTSFVWYWCLRAQIQENQQHTLLFLSCLHARAPPLPCRGSCTLRSTDVICQRFISQTFLYCTMQMFNGSITSASHPHHKCTRLLAFCTNACTCILSNCKGILSRSKMRKYLGTTCVISHASLPQLYFLQTVGLYALKSLKPQPK